MKTHGTIGKWLLWTLALAWGQGCIENPTEPNAAHGGNVAIVQPPAAQPDTTALHARIVRLDSELTVLKADFKMDTRNLPVPSYYHKNWNYRYYIHDNAMMAGVDESGVFFLIDSYNCSLVRQDDEVVRDRFQGMSVCNYKTSRMELRWRDTTIVMHHDLNLIGRLWPQVKQPVRHDSRISTGYFCTDFYPVSDNPDLIHRLADTAVGSFRFYRYCENEGRGDIGIAEKRDRTGIRDCARLSELITERAKLQAEREKLISSAQ